MTVSLPGLVAGISGPMPAMLALVTARPLSSLQLRATQLWDGTLAWWSARTGDILVALAAGLAIFIALSLLRRLAVNRARAARGSTDVASILWDVLARTWSSVLALGAARLVAGIADAPAIVADAIGFAFTVAAVFQGAVWARALILALIGRRAAEGDSETLVNAAGVLRVLVSVAVFAIAIIVILDNLGVNVTGLVAGLGIGGIAIGLAAQGIFSDLFAALAIIFDRPFRNGDTIRWDQTTAVVERIGLKSTRLRAVGGEQLVVSNTMLLGKEIANFARLERRRVTFMLTLVQHTPPAALRALPDALRQVTEAMGIDFVRASMTGIGASSIDFELLADVRSDDYDIVAAQRTELGIRVLELLAARGLALAYPTQTTFTASPDGRLVWPYPMPADEAPSSRANGRDAR